MNVAATVAELKKLPGADRVRIAQELMEGLDDPGLSPAEVDAAWAEIDRRRADALADPRAGVSWDQLRARLAGKAAS